MRVLHEGFSCPHRSRLHPQNTPPEPPPHRPPRPTPQNPRTAQLFPFSPHLTAAVLPCRFPHHHLPHRFSAIGCSSSGATYSAASVSSASSSTISGSSSAYTGHPAPENEVNVSDIASINASFFLFMSSSPFSQQNVAFLYSCNSILSPPQILLSIAHSSSFQEDLTFYPAVCFPDLPFTGLSDKMTSGAVC